MMSTLQVEKSAKMQDVKTRDNSELVLSSLSASSEADPPSTMNSESLPIQFVLRQCVTPSRADSIGEVNRTEERADGEVKKIRSEEEKQMIGTQAQETSATDSDKSEPRLVTALVERVEGLECELQVLSKGLKETTRC
jgi:hypothetical protein